MKIETGGDIKPSTIKLIIPVSDNSEFFSEAADYASVELTAGSIARIRELASVVRNLEVYRISEFNYGCDFTVADYEADPENGKVATKEFEGQMECNTLNVTDNNFFWSGYYKHTSVRWESASVPLTALDEGGDYDLREEISDEKEAD